MRYIFNGKAHSLAVQLGATLCLMHRQVERPLPPALLGFVLRSEAAEPVPEDELKTVIPGISTEESQALVDFYRNEQTSAGIFTEQEICDQIVELEDITEDTADVKEVTCDETDEAKPTAFEALKWYIC